MDTYAKPVLSAQTMLKARLDGKKCCSAFDRDWYLVPVVANVGRVEVDVTVL